MPTRASRARGILVAATSAALLSPIVTIVTPAAAAAQAAHPAIVNAMPAAYTPNVNSGKSGVVYAITKVGSTIYIGGTFTSISPYNSSVTTTVSNLAAFDAGTGAIQTGFKPAVSGEVDTLAPGPTPGTLYVGGNFSSIDGVTTHLALIDATTGAIASGWTSLREDGVVNRVQLVNGQLFVGGAFTHLSSKTSSTGRNGFATLDPTSGALTSYSTLAFTGHHNYGVNCTGSTCAQGSVNVKAFDASPDGTHMVVLGNYTDISGTPRNQIAMLDLDPSGVTVDPDWDTQAYTSKCDPTRFDYAVRDVQYSPDGSYFAVVATGAGGLQAVNADGTKANCDAVTRFEADATGDDVQPTWSDWTGNDSFWSVAVTGAAIYAGGHPRWVNNSVGQDAASYGAVGRAGIVALDPQNGLPNSWNPGRNPRGAGAYALLPTADGLYVGSDTDYIGNYQYFHAKLAYFPLAGGEVPPANAVGSLPGDVYLFSPVSSPGSVEPIVWDGSGPPQPGASVTSFNPQNVRGAFDVDGTLYYGASDGNFYEAPFNGISVGTPTAPDPYNDPYWSTIRTGTGTTTYRGVKPLFYGEITSLTSMFYSEGRIYYTLAGNPHMYWRFFETDDGVIGSREFMSTDGNDWSHVAGAFLSGDTLYFADSATGNLMSVPFDGSQPSGTPSLADNTVNWASRGAVVISQSQVINDVAPSASFTVNCTTTDVPCTADASASSDPDGSIATYSWDWGDGSTSQTNGAVATHQYPVAATYTVHLTVTDNLGATASAPPQSATVTSLSAPAIAFRDAAAWDAGKANVTSGSVTVPASVRAGDEMLLFETYNSTGINVTQPAGWTMIGKVTSSNLTSYVLARPAAAADAGSKLTVNFSGTVHATLTLAAYANAANPVEAAVSGSDVNTANHVSPTANGLTAGSYALTFWGDKASTTSKWTAPAGVTTRSAVYGAGGGAVSALLVDSGGAVAGSYGGLLAKSDVVSGSTVSWTVALATAS
jgi:hypothetical protein